MQNAALSRQEKSLVLNSTQQGLKFTDAVATARSLSRSCVGGARQGILVTEDAGGPLWGDKEQGACAANKKAK